ncbi:polyprotein [Phytophthora megakarya]|uniref:Polyprotein n=1 Tax=Phytophthora megakarya TaxID=4795 RepID=A0A225W813_9STRA|nr:polyprotein [Phytophthora megakarya]
MILGYLCYVLSGAFTVCAIAHSITSLFPHRGLLYYSTDPEDTPRVVNPHDEELKYQILYEAHNSPVAGHLGREKIYGSVSRHYWWSKLYMWTKT